MRNGSISEIKGVLEADDAAENFIMHSHFEGEVWGLEPIEGDKVLTCGDDNKIMLYNYNEKKVERTGKVSDHKPKNAAKVKSVTASSMSIYPPNQQARAITYSSVHKHIAIASNMGKISVRDFNDFDKKVATLKDPQEWCEVLRYSPCHKFLAAASHDNILYVYSVSDEGEYKLYKSFNKHSSYI